MVAQIQLHTYTPRAKVNCLFSRAAPLDGPVYDFSFLLQLYVQLVDYREVNLPVESELGMESDFVLMLILLTTLPLYLTLVTEGNDGLVDQVLTLF